MVRKQSDFRFFGKIGQILGQIFENFSQILIISTLSIGKVSRAGYSVIFTHTLTFFPLNCDFKVEGSHSICYFQQDSKKLTVKVKFGCALILVMLTQAQNDNLTRSLLLDHKYDVQAFLADKNIAKIEYRALKAIGGGVHGQKMKFALSERTR